MFAGCRFSSGASDHLVYERTCDRLLQTVHESGHLHHDQKARETEAWSLLIHGAPIQRDLDVYHLRLPWSLRGAVPGLQILPLRVADRGLR